MAREHVDVEVIREGKRGLLGFGGEDAIVRVTTKDDRATPGRGRRRGRGGRRGGQRGESAPREDRGASRDDGPRDDGPRDEDRGNERKEGPPREDRGDERDEGPPREDRGDERDEGPPREDRGGGRRGRRGGRGGRGRRRGGERGRERSGAGNRDRDSDHERIPFEGELPLVPGAPDDLPTAPTAGAEDEIDFAGSTLREVLTLLGLLDTQIEARDPETPGDGVGRTAQVFEIFGDTEDASDELGLLIGRRGETLGALQYLLNVVTRHHYGEANHVFSVDVEGYKRRRERSLVEMARRVAAEVRDTGDVITLEPMKPAERRIVHLTLSQEPGVTTESVGSGNERQVEVLPTDYDDYEAGYDDYDEGADYAGDEPVAEQAEDDAEPAEDFDDETGEDLDDEDDADDAEPAEDFDDETGGDLDDEDDADDEGPAEDFDDEDDADDAGPAEDFDDEASEDDKAPNR